MSSYPYSGNPASTANQPATQVVYGVQSALKGLHERAAAIEAGGLQPARHNYPPS